MSSEVLVARRSFIATVKGKTVHVYSGDHAHADHAVVRALPDAFRPLKVKFAVESKPGRTKS